MTMWMCLFCNDIFDESDDDRPPICLMCRIAHNDEEHPSKESP